MGKTLINFWISNELLKEMDYVVSKSDNKYKDRTQFMILAIQRLLKEEDRNGE